MMIVTEERIKSSMDLDALNFKNFYNHHTTIRGIWMWIGIKDTMLDYNKVAMLGYDSRNPYYSYS